VTNRLTPIIVVGARGRMGHQLVRDVLESDNMTLAGAVDKSDDRPADDAGEDAGKMVGMPSIGLEVMGALRPSRGSVVVDFSLPEATDINIQLCLDAQVPLVLGTTGIGDETIAKLREAAKVIPIVSAANFSVGVTLLIKLASLATRALGPSWDAELVELHHRHKRDAPSGTALRIAKAVAQASGRSRDDYVLGRAGNGDPRASSEIGVAALRGGGSVGEHTLMLMGDGERIELTHRAMDRSIFAHGALRAACWVAAQEPGLYDMADVLGLSDLG
jgi:4-hydroxy-tetrahydrodipicolinate reductase